MKLTAKDAADRLGVSYVIAAGIMSHLENVGKAKVVEKKFHSSGKGKPTRVYEVEQLTTIDFGAEAAVPKATESIAEILGVVAEAVESGEKVLVVVPQETIAEEKVEKIETLDHVAAALARLKADNAA